MTVIRQEHLDYLDVLRESGQANMFGAGQYIRQEFGESKEAAREILKYWMDNFNEEGTKLKEGDQ
jgi:uncharacterized protein YciI|tara:strand:+ start:328 stop:522 length:195 start_codon:yes stop_codon:yes gene_type:complete